jgi:hypothetical protein
MGRADQGERNLDGVRADNFCRSNSGYLYSVFRELGSAQAANSVPPSPLWGGSARSAGVGVAR